MTIEEKLNYMKIMGGLDSEDDDTLMVYLDLAKEELLNHIYPFGHEAVELEKRYDTKQIELALILFNQRGAEGEESHNENGVNRKYQSKEKFLASIPRKAGIPK